MPQATHVILPAPVTNLRFRKYTQNITTQNLAQAAQICDTPHKWHNYVLGATVFYPWHLDITQTLDASSRYGVAITEFASLKPDHDNKRHSNLVPDQVLTHKLIHSLLTTCGEGLRITQHKMKKISQDTKLCRECQGKPNHVSLEVLNYFIV